MSKAIISKIVEKHESEKTVHAIITIRLTHEQHAKIKEIAEKNEIPMQKLLLGVIEETLLKE